MKTGASQGEVYARRDEVYARRDMRKTRKKQKPKRRNEEGRTFRVHPLFLLAGAYACLSRSLLLYLGAVLVALEHECAHSFAAARLGFRLNRVVLMPYGAVISGNLEGISFKDEIRVAAAGPLCNLFTALLFAALWWLFPDTYAYTDTAFYLSLFIGAGNLLPLYPLDGGRVFKCALAMKAGEKTALKICRTISVCAAGVIFAAAIMLAAQGKGAFSLFASAAFLCFGAFSGGGRYEKIQPDYAAAFLRGVEIKRAAADGNMTLKRALALCESGKYLILEVYSGGKKSFETEEQDLYNAVSGENLYRSLSQIFGRAAAATSRKLTENAPKNKKRSEYSLKNVKNV